MTKTYIDGSAATVTLNLANSPLYNTGFIEPPFASGDNGVFSNTTGVSLYNLTGTSVIEGGTGNGSGAAGIGVDFQQSGTLTNAYYISGGVNYGTGTGGIGVSMVGGTLDNKSGGTIDGGQILDHGTGNGGVGVSLSAGVLNNYAAIHGGAGFAVDQSAGNGGDGVDLTAGATLNNNSGGQITGGFGLALGGIGVSASGTGTMLYNHNSIMGGGVYSDAFNGYPHVSGVGGAGVKLSAGAQLTNYGSVSGGNGSQTGPAGVGAVIGAYGTLINDSTGTVASATVATNGSLTNTGTITASLHSAGIAGSGFGVDVDGGKLTTTGGTIHGVYLSGGGTLTTSGYITSGFGGDVEFGSGGGTMTINSGATFHPGFGSANIAGFAVGDTIDVTYQDMTAVKAEFDSGSYTLTLNNGPDSIFDTLVFGGNFSGDTFSFLPDDNGKGTGTDITLVACYLSGTRILTERGEIAIEALKIGDRVMTNSGSAHPIRWIGRRQYDAWFASGNCELAPVRIRAGAISHEVPRRDLWVSPEHAMFIDGMLIPAAALVNGVSILQEETADDVTYFHLEFDSHAVIFAEGAPAESFVDDESREMFDNAREYHVLYPSSIREPARFCAPRVEDGEELEDVRRRLAERCGVGLGFPGGGVSMAPAQAGIA